MRGFREQAFVRSQPPAPLSENLRTFQRFSKDSLSGSSVLCAAMRRSSSLLPALLMLGALGLFSTEAPAQNRKPRTGKPATAKTTNHAKIVAAINSLEAAKTELQHSDGNFGGHKQDALDAVNNALKQLRLALQFEKY